MSVPQKAYFRARPIRVAFLVNDHEHSGVMLDAIFKNCMGRWGGRFSLIVPTTEAGPKENYLNWLEAFDPDIMYSYVDLDNTAVERLHERFYPSFLIRHEFYERTETDVHAFHPKLPIEGLKITSLIPLATLPTIFNDSRNGRFPEAMGRLHDSPFVQDSFGLFSECAGHSYSAPLNEFGSTLTLVADADCQPRARYLPQAGETVSDIPALLDFARTKNLITMSQLSAMATPRLDISSRSWGNTFNIIIGDTFTDRVVYWNARSLFPKWRDREFVDLRIPASYLADAGILDAIGKFLARRNHVSGHSSGSTPYATIGSSSVPLADLNACAAALQGNGDWVQYRAKTFATPDDCLPTDAELEHAAFAVAENFTVGTASFWNETYASDGQIDINPPAPEPLKYCPAHLQSSHVGAWAIDVDIDRKVDHSRISNVHHRWRLPRRLRITNAFLKGYAISGRNSAMVAPRVMRDGLLTCYANVTTKPVAVKLPDDEEAIAGAFTSGRDWWPFFYTPNGHVQEQLLRDVRRSENGRYFAGTLGIFKTLNAATDILLHRFWREQLEKLGASPRQTERNREVVENTLTNRFGAAGATLPRDKTKLATIILQQAEQHRTSIPCRSWTDFEKDFLVLQDRHWQAYQTEDGFTAEHDEMRKDEILSFKRGVQELCEKGILYQGYERKCSKCLHRSWFAIGNLSPQIKCEVCMNEEPAPVDRPWQFRLNEFVREALRKHGVWPLYWTLSKIRRMQEASFYFAGPLDVFITGTRWDANNDTDIDLTIISDGQVRMCEVKQSIRQLSQTVATDYASLMLRLRPDIATLAVMETKTPPLEAIFDDFRQKLQGSGIAPELLTLDENADFDDSTPAYGRFTVRMM